MQCYTIPYRIQTIALLETPWLTGLAALGQKGIIGVNSKPFFSALQHGCSGNLPLVPLIVGTPHMIYGWFLQIPT